MRVVSEIIHPKLKITIFHHNAKYTVQFEDGNVVQHYIVREGDDISTVQDVQALLDDDFILNVQTSLNAMRNNWQEKLLSQIDDTEFEEII